MPEVNTAEIYRNALRVFIRDHSDINRLLKFEEENPNENLLLYIDLAFGFLNVIPPLIRSFTFANFPMPVLIIHQAAIEALISNGILHARNDLTYNNGGITVKISDKERYLPILDWLTRLTDKQIEVFKQIKVSINIDAGWGGVSSPYASLHSGQSYSLRTSTIL